MSDCRCLNCLVIGPGQAALPSVSDTKRWSDRLLAAMETKMATTRCKFTCIGVTKRVPGYRVSDGETPRFLYEAEFTAVSDGSEENKRFFQWTPSGSLKIGVYKEDVFEPGRSYYVDVAPTDT